MSGDRHKRICAKSAHPWNTGVNGCAIIFAVAMQLTLAGCASSLRSTSSHDQEQKRVHRLEMELRRTKASLQDLKDRNLVLEKRLNRSRDAEKVAHESTVPVPFEPSAAKQPRTVEASLPVTHSVAVPAIETERPSIASASNAVPGVSAPVLPQSTLPVQKVGRAQTGEHFLYSKILETYRKRKSGELNKSLRIFLKTYPDSVFADNGLYLAGLLALESHEDRRAATYMDRLLREYPKGNKAVSALFAKGILEKRNKNYSKAKDLFESVQRLYPGSPEAKRVSVELKLLRMAASQKRES